MIGVVSGMESETFEQVQRHVRARVILEAVVDPLQR